MLLVHQTVLSSNMQIWSVCSIQNRNIALTVIRSEFKRIRSSLRLFLKDFTSLELESNLQCQLKGKPGGLIKGNNHIWHWLLLVKRSKRVVLQIVKSIRSLRDSHILGALLRIPAFNKTLVYCKEKSWSVECPDFLTLPLPPKQMSLQAATLSMWNSIGEKIKNEGVKPARFTLACLNSVFPELHSLFFFPLYLILVVCSLLPALLVPLLPHPVSKQPKQVTKKSGEFAMVLSSMLYR